MNTIHLHGAMRKRFGQSFDLTAKTPAEAVHALSCMLPGFRQAIAAGCWRVVRGALRGGRSLTKDELGVNLGGEMHLIAAPQGAGGRGGSGKIIIGTVLVIAAAVLTWWGGGFGGAAVAAGQGAAAGASAGGAAAFGAVTGAGLGTSVGVGLGLSVSAAQLGFLGASMLFAGISQAIAPSPKAGAGVAQDMRASFTFNGAINSSEQGVARPLAFGRIRAGAVIIGASIVAEDIST